MCVCEWEEAGPAVGYHTVGSFTHDLKIKKLLQGPRMMVNPTALALGQDAPCPSSLTASTDGQSPAA